eukprot:5240271-Prymnesium_polylepis.1
MYCTVCRAVRPAVRGGGWPHRGTDPEIYLRSGKSGARGPLRVRGPTPEEPKSGLCAQWNRPRGRLSQSEAPLEDPLSPAFRKKSSRDSRER